MAPSAGKKYCGIIPSGTWMATIRLGGVFSAALANAGNAKQARAVMVRHVAGFQASLTS